jgi:hypothetical protein
MTKKRVSLIFKMTILKNGKMELVERMKQVKMLNNTWKF